MDKDRHILRYETQAKEWMEGLPIGNGRLAAMIEGDQKTDRIRLNHEWLWRGVHKNRDNPKVSHQLEQIRTLLQAGDFFGATCVANTYLGGRGGVSGFKNRVDAYQPAGDMTVTIHNSEFVRRSLDMQHGIVHVSRQTAQSRIKSEFFAHPTHQLIFAGWQAESKCIQATIGTERADDPKAERTIKVDQDMIYVYTAFEDGIAFAVKISFFSDGDVSVKNNLAHIKDASYIHAAVNIATDVHGIEHEFDRYPMTDVSWNALRESHKSQFRREYDQFELNIDVPLPNVSTEQLIKNAKKQTPDPYLMMQYVHFGRYLLICSSMFGELPANLQGKWNEKIEPPWECDYHFDINLQMNYWAAEATGLSKCHDTLLRYVESFIPHARKAAADLYGCRGIWLPIQTDAWGRATPESFGYAAWIGAAPWIAQHFWRHYQYTQDKEFLETRAYPFIRETVAFFEDYLVEDETGTLAVMPSQSPENRFSGTGFWPVSIGINAASDVQMIADVFDYAIECAKILQRDKADILRWQQFLSRLPEFAIASDGRLLEWDIEREEAEPGHRHLSHLYGLYPAELFTPEKRREQYLAAKASLEYRLEQGGGHTGWSRAWVSCLYARLAQSERAYEHLCGLIRDFATVSLLDLHPPRIFQIDGNLGAVAAAVECIVQCWGNKVHLLRALPDAWHTGSVRGVRLHGAHILDMDWQQGRPVRIAVRMGSSRDLVLACMGKYAAPNDQKYVVGEDVCVPGKPGLDLEFHMVRDT